jgi:hypothetical protein
MRGKKVFHNTLMARGDKVECHIGLEAKGIHSEFIEQY